jgi:hypothetical protein
MKNNYGFVAPTYADDHYVLGSSNSLVKIILCSDGQWDNYLPGREMQNINDVETYNCTSFGTCNVFETMFKKMYAKNDNFSDRFVGIEAGTKPPGNDPHIVAEAIRHKGLISETLLPFKDITSWMEYYSWKGGDKGQCESKGQEFLGKWIMGHEWVYQNKPQNWQDLLIESLKYSPLGISVSAWYQGQNGLYVDNGQPNNHWVCLYGYVKGQYWKVFDSYDLSTKRLAWNFNFNYCKRYGILVNVEPQYQNILSKLLAILKGYLSILSKSIGSIIVGIYSKRN